MRRAVCERSSIIKLTIIVVEDETRVLTFLTEALRKEGHTVYPCATFAEATENIAAVGPAAELVIMDRILDRIDAISLIPQIREKCANAKILVLSTITDPAQKAAALDLGADDYLGKPFQLIELSARIRSLARRASDTTGAVKSVFAVGDIQINAIEHKVTVDAKPVDLSNKEYSVLLTLMQHPGRVYNKFQLLDRVWDTQFDVESNVVEVTIKNLRRKLEAAGSKTEILSRRNIGYWIEA